MGQDWTPAGEDRDWTAQKVQDQRRMTVGSGGGQRVRYPADHIVAWVDRDGRGL
jgi:hypothetical protein